MTLQRLTAAGYQVVQVRPDEWRVTTSRRPPWATIVGGAGLLAFGLGAPLLALREVRHATIREVNDLKGTRLVVSGDLEAELRRLLETPRPDSLDKDGEVSENGVEAAEGAAVPAGTTGPVTARRGGAPLADALHEPRWPQPGDYEDHDDDATTVVRPRLEGPAAEPPMGLRFLSGQVVPIGHGLVVGRDPSPEEGCEVVAVGDAASGVSKTHFGVRVAGDGAWLEDRASSNGTNVVRAGHTRRLGPASQEKLQTGDVIAFGLLTADVVKL